MEPIHLLMFSGLGGPGPPHIPTDSCGCPPSAVEWSIRDSGQVTVAYAHFHRVWASDRDGLQRGFLPAVPLLTQDLFTIWPTPALGRERFELKFGLKFQALQEVLLGSAVLS